MYDDCKYIVISGSQTIMATFEKVRTIVADQLGVEAEEVTPNSTFVDDLGADSLDIVELIMRFEDEFGVEIPDEKAEKIKTVNDIVKYIDGGAKE